MKRVLSLFLILTLFFTMGAVAAQAQETYVDVSFRDMDTSTNLNASRANYGVERTNYTQGSASIAYTLKDDCASQLLFYVYRQGGTSDTVNIAGATLFQFDLWVPSDGYFDNIKGDAGVNIDSGENVSKWGSSAGKVSAATVKAGLKNLKAGWNFISLRLDAPSTCTNAVDFRLYMLNSGVTAGDVIYMDDFRFVNDLADYDTSYFRNQGKQVNALIRQGEKATAKALYNTLTPRARDYVSSELLSTIPVTPIAAPREYTLSFNTNGGTPVDDQQVCIGERPLYVADPVKTGKPFMGWYLGDTKIDLATFAMPRKDVTLTARFQGDTYALKIDTDGGLPYAPTKEYAPDQGVEIPRTPVKEGYTFAGWYQGTKKVDLTTFTMPWEGVTLTAKWVEGADTRGFGNVNGDTKIDAKDALELLKSTVGKTTFTEDQVFLGEVTADGVIDAKDALAVLKKSVGKLDVFPCVAYYESQNPQDPQEPSQPELPTEPDPEPVEFDVNIMTFNIRQSGANNELDGNDGWLNRKEAVIAYLNQSGDDVICLQEVRKTQGQDITAGLSSQYQGVYFGREPIANPEGLMTIYNANRFELVSTQLFWLSETPDVASKGWGANYYRICAVLVLKEKATGKLLNVYNVHLDHQVEEARVNGLKLVMERKNAAQGHSIVAGDFNTTSSSSCYQIIANEMTNCQIYGKAFSTCQGFGAGKGNQNGSPIDFIFVDPTETAITSYKIANDTFTDFLGEMRNYSDHYAVKSTVTFIY